MIIGDGLTMRAGRGPLKIVLVLLLPALVAGCLQMERTVQVNRDGSGLLIERLVMSNEMVEMAGGMQPEGQTFNVRNDEELRGKAADYGESVRFVSATDVETEFGKGYEARYAFDDINSLRISRNNVGSNVPGARPDDKETTYTTFTMRGANPTELMIHWTDDSADSDPAEDVVEDSSKQPQTPEQEQMAMEMMKTMFKDMRMAMHVEIMGDIVETDATHLSGSRITLMDLDIGEVFSNMEAIVAMGGKRPESADDMQKLAELFPGSTMEMKSEVAVRFQ